MSSILKITETVLAAILNIENGTMFDFFLVEWNSSKILSLFIAEIKEKIFVKELLIVIKDRDPRISRSEDGFSNCVGLVRCPGQSDFDSWIPDQGLKELYIMSADVEDLTKNIIRYRDQERFIQSKFFRKIFKSFRITPRATTCHEFEDEVLILDRDPTI